MTGQGPGPMAPANEDARIHAKAGSGLMKTLR